MAGAALSERRALAEQSRGALQGVQQGWLGHGHQMQMLASGAAPGKVSCACGSSSPLWDVPVP